MEKYKFRSTVYLVFLLVSLFVNGLLLYMLITDYGHEDNDNFDKVNINALMSDAEIIYKDAYELINGVESNFYIPNDYVDVNNPNSACYLVNFDGLEYYFTSELIKNFKNNLIQHDNRLYDCNGEVSKILNSSIFNKNKKENLEYISFDNDILLGKINNLYVVFKNVNGKLLIDSF